MNGWCKLLQTVNTDIPIYVIRSMWSTREKRETCWKRNLICIFFYFCQIQKFWENQINILKSRFLISRSFIRKIRHFCKGVIGTRLCRLCEFWKPMSRDLHPKYIKYRINLVIKDKLISELAGCKSALLSLKGSSFEGCYRGQPRLVNFRSPERLRSFRCVCVYLETWGEVSNPPTL